MRQGDEVSASFRKHTASVSTGNEALAPSPCLIPPPVSFPHAKKDPPPKQGILETRRFIAAMPRVARLRGARDNHHRNRQDDHAGDAQHHEQLAAELQVQLAAELGDALLNVLGLDRKSVV